MAGHPEPFDDQALRRALARGGSLGFASGLLIGIAAGLIGVGGGEFRIPVLLHVLRLPVKIAAGANTVIGLFVVALSLARRWGQQALSADDITTGLVMATVSVAGAVIGARHAHRIASPALKAIVNLYLLAVGVWMIVEAFLHAEHTLLEPVGPARWALAAVLGLLIAAASGALGVAGGEMRIPALMYLFAMPVKVTGTVSLIASIPTVAAGAFTYRRLGHIPDRVLLLAVVMGVGSLIGVLIGAALLPLVDQHTLKGLLGAILLAATACLSLPGLGKARGRNGSSALEKPEPSSPCG